MSPQAIKALLETLGNLPLDVQRVLAAKLNSDIKVKEQRERAIALAYSTLEKAGHDHFYITDTKHGSFEVKSDSRCGYNVWRRVMGKTKLRRGERLATGYRGGLTALRLNINAGCFTK